MKLVEQHSLSARGAVQEAPRMHILILASYAPSLLNFRGPLIRDMLAAKHRVSVGAPDISTELRRQLVELGAEVHDTPMERNGTGMLADLRYCKGLRRLIGSVRPDVVLTYTIKPNIWGAFAAHSVGVASVAMVTGLGYAFTDTGVAPSPTQRVTGLIARRLYRAATSRNRRVLFQNPDDKADFIRAGCLADPSKVGMINGSGVDTEHYARQPLPSDPVVLMIARLLGNKGVRDYAEAALRLRKSHPQARFQLVGPFDGGPDAIAEGEVAAWTAQGLEYLGAAEDVRPHIAQARIYVLPSYREGTPRSVLEAMAMGRPVVTTNAPGCRETVEDGVNGRLVPVRDPSALTEAIAYLLDHPAEAEAMGEAGFQLVARKYDVRQVNRAIMELMGLPPAPPHTATFMP
ncbi:glycosyltransferase family 4 protein [Tianweitania populi]|uniref:Glycosyl transferase n=1 Tax=Tianweitania populi TaxID=1607949 RepID=A0A8J3GIP8_9HYPH|nr:glycosyltransferase family 4 protein [Tianweitania populi]GHD05611.1 glycosyl transferase [Tianweitania populi]